MSCAGTGPFALQFGSLLNEESRSAQMHRRPKMSGGAALFPDAADNANTRTGSHARRCRNRSFREDRSRKQQHNPKYAKQERGVTSKKLYQDAAGASSSVNKLSLNESALKRRESLTKKRVETCVKASNDSSNSLEATMGFCGSVTQVFESVKNDPKGEMFDTGAASKPERMEEDMDTVAQASGSGFDSGEGRVAPPMYGENAVEDLYATLREYLQVEAKFQPNPVLPVNPQRGEISAGTRDGAAHVLRCLKIWYDLPTDVLCHAINLLDRFLTKMKVRPCHVSCISVSCMNMAIVSHRPQLPTINTEDLVSISQCKCTVGDVRRMSAVIGEKLGAVGESITPLHWLRLLGRLFHWAAPQVVPSLMQETDMINRLEILSCDASCCNIRSCELALVLLCTQLDSQLTVLQRTPSVQNSDRMAELTRLVHFAMELQRVCQIGDESFYASHQAVVNVLERYNARQKTPHRQRLVWRVSSRTLKVLRPTDRLTSMLPTIEEQHTSPQQVHPSETANRLRSGSESSDDLSEESKDWPTSPLVPVICNDN